MGIVNAVTGVFTATGTWLVDQIGAFQQLFWTTSGGEVELTFLGVLCLIGLAISVSLLFVNMIKGFMRLH